MLSYYLTVIFDENRILTTILMQYLGRFYILDVLTRIGKGQVRSPMSILADIEEILNDSRKKDRPEYPVAVLSNIDRDTWTEGWVHFCNFQQNEFT